MKYCAILFLLTVTLVSCGGNEGAGGSGGPQAAAIDGKALFDANCAGCHKDGGNVINPARTLHRRDLAANGIRKPADIVNKMRRPGSGMPKFEKARLSDAEAQAIAEYVMGAF